MKILCLSQWWRPEPANLVVSLVDSFAARGHDVQVLTGFPNYPTGRLYPGYRMRIRQIENQNGVRVIRTPLLPSHDSSAFRRSANYLSFALSSSTVGLASVKRPDVAYVYHPPITAVWPARLMKRLCKVPYVIHVQDLWPDAVSESGMIGHARSHSITERALERLVNGAYRRAAHIVVITPGFKQALIDRGVPADRISVIRNWAPLEAAASVDPRLRPHLGPADRRIVLFAGNIGPFQNLELIIRQIGRLEERTELHLAILGGGIDRERLQRLVTEMAITNVSFLDRCPPDTALAYQQLADVNLVSLADYQFLSATIPSKTGVVMSLGKPILMVANGDAADLVQSAGCGITSAPTADAVSKALLNLAGLSEHDLVTMGKNGACFYRQHLHFDVAANRFAEILETAV